MSRKIVPSVAALAILACGPSRPLVEESRLPTDRPTHQELPIEPFGFANWAPATWSPRPAAVADSASWLRRRCARADAALEEVARRLALDEHFGARPDDLDRLAFALRASGSPYVWPRAWRMPASADVSPAEVEAHFDNWMQSFNDGGERRCGLAAIQGNNSVTYAAVASDVVADLVEPLPTLARTGQWLRVHVKLLRDASEAKVVVQGTLNEPAFVPTTLENREVIARFPVMGPGPWLIQVIATMDTGPRPVVTAELFADEAPPKALDWRPAPGESAGSQAQDPAKSLYAMLNAARAAEGRKWLIRDPRLDQLAQEHAEAMLAVGHVGHDVGDGSPKSRLDNAGIFAALAGENVAHAADAVRAHRALWASPSHRSNILHRGFRNVGVGVVRGPDHTVWACELFAALD